MKLYVANTTRQNWDLTYRVPETRNNRMQPIQAGGQVAVSGELSREQVGALVEQFELYGACDATKVAQHHEHISLLWSIDRPVTRNQMLQALERNLAVMDKRGVDQRKAAALTATDAMEHLTPGDAFHGMEMSLEEQSRPNGAEATVHEQHVVDRSGSMHYEGRRGDAPVPPKRGRGRRRAA